MQAPLMTRFLLPLGHRLAFISQPLSSLMSLSGFHSVPLAAYLEVSGTAAVLTFHDQLFLL